MPKPGSPIRSVSTAGSGDTGNDDGVDLAPEQSSAIERIGHGGGSVFFVTGRAGTGKSTILRHLAAKWAGQCAVVAPTGLAALHVGGQTIHSLFGLPLGPIAEYDPGVRVYSRGHPRSRVLRNTKALIVDEVSMVRADVLDAMDWSLRQNCDSEEPFAGKTVVLFGDPWQLEPIVEPGATTEMLRDRFASPFFFDSQAFKMAVKHVFELQHVHRQTEPEYLWALDRVRVGDPDGLDFFNERVGADVPHRGRVTLTSTNRHSDALNQQALAALPGVGQLYRATPTGDFGDQIPVDRELKLKEGAQVMFAQNGPNWRNGTMGTVTSCREDGAEVATDSVTFFVPPATWERYRYVWDSHRARIEREVVGTFTQLPLRLAWAMTVHKAQGQTLDRAIVDLDAGGFAHGMTYVALSRCRSIAGLSLANRLTASDLFVHESVARFMSRLSP